ncbi:MAG: hypoxanthine phosphoribosyltransferase [Bacteroidales bacterium]|nr:hypoxanthine phosphoribosyltransferase [Bacteroidales bacterium]
MDNVRILDKEFKLFISEKQIQEAVERMASRMNKELKGQKIFLIGILNGCFMFAADLIRNLDLDCTITFLKLASYQGTSSTGKVKRLIGLNEDIKDQVVVVLEDIVDTGITLDFIQKQLRGYEPAEIKLATLLYKPEACRQDVSLDYVGIEIPDDFVVGYGLDYNGYGRNLRQIYTVIE